MTDESVQVVENAIKAVKYLKSRGCDDIEFSPEDAGRSEPDFLYRILEEVIKAGATTLNIPDTVRGRRYLSGLCASAGRFTDSLCRSGGVCRTSLGKRLRALSETRRAPGMWSSLRTAKTIWGWPLPTAWRAPTQAHGSANAPSTGLESVPGTPPWKRWPCP